MVAPDVQIEDGKGTILISSEEGETEGIIHCLCSLPLIWTQTACVKECTLVYPFTIYGTQYLS